MPPIGLLPWGYPVATRSLHSFLLERRSNSAQTHLQTLTGWRTGSSAVPLTHGVSQNWALCSVTDTLPAAVSAWMTSAAAGWAWWTQGAGVQEAYEPLLVHPTYPRGMSRYPPPSSPPIGGIALFPAWSLTSGGRRGSLLSMIPSLQEAGEALFPPLFPHLRRQERLSSHHYSHLRRQERLSSHRCTLSSMVGRLSSHRCTLSSMVGRHICAEGYHHRKGGMYAQRVPP